MAEVVEAQPVWLDSAIDYPSDPSRDNLLSAATWILMGILSIEKYSGGLMQRYIFLCATLLLLPGCSGFGGPGFGAAGSGGSENVLKALT